ncbi:MAG: hypothetical protein ACD_23C00964G0002 [uncultured bacterium]|nr:MAG: hypothetical protein ACD_23C00964G0002 [uncultured bacterium]
MSALTALSSSSSHISKANINGHDGSDRISLEFALVLKYPIDAT